MYGFTTLAAAGVAQVADRQFMPGQFPQGGPPGGFAGRGGMPGGRMLFGPLGGTAMLLLLGLTLIVLTIVFFKVFIRTGHPGALGLLMLVPVVNLGVLTWFAFSKWPVEAEVERLSSLLAVQAARTQEPPVDQAS